ncbi:hypothetical protein [Bradyrhizobium elkanii]|uniref:hypothetical protein n=1 Tax=Bradyrhizobium elkanii TaxID=29448 RepID=UPI00272C4BCF|nr:hypothetical protein [Bradyrhizobium elkanii]WLA86886.1 hypothetical protein QNJ99_23285 [Bradyrhizobium elkanii]
MTTRDDGGLSQAIAQFHSIVEMVSALRKSDSADSTDDARDAARQAIEDDALSVEVRTGWFNPYSRDADRAPAEYCILLCTGGPAVRIVGNLSEHCEPESAVIEYQDWFKPWTRWTPGNSHNVESILLDYARVFHFGE